MTVFVAGYVATWMVFSLLASLMQWGLLEVRLVSPLMVAASPLTRSSHHAGDDFARLKAARAAQKGA